MVFLVKNFCTTYDKVGVKLDYEVNYKELREAFKFFKYNLQCFSKIWIRAKDVMLLIIICSDIERI